MPRLTTFYCVELTVYSHKYLQTSAIVPNTSSFRASSFLFCHQFSYCFFFWLSKWICISMLTSKNSNTVKYYYSFKCFLF